MSSRCASYVYVRYVLAQCVSLLMTAKLHHRVLTVHRVMLQVSRWSFAMGILWRSSLQVNLSLIVDALLYDSWGFAPCTGGKLLIKNAPNESLVNFRSRFVAKKWLELSRYIGFGKLLAINWGLILEACVTGLTLEQGSIPLILEQYLLLMVEQCLHQ